MANYVAGANYTYSDYAWLYDNAHKYTLTQLAEITKRSVESLQGRLRRMGICKVTSVGATTKATIREYYDLGDALIFLLPTVPLPVIKEVLDEE